MLYLRFIVVCLFIQSAMADTSTFYAYQSEQGDYIGAGQAHSLTVPAASITADGTHSALMLSAKEDADYWHMLISAPQGISLTDQTYTHATAWGSTVDPQLLVGVNRRGCSVAKGNFKVEQLDWGAAAINALAIDFEQQCDHATAALFGVIRYHSFVKNDLAQFILSRTTKTSIYLYSQVGDAMGEGKTEHFSRDDKDYNVYTSGHDNHLTIEYNPSGYWYFDFAAADKKPLAKGYYPNASRYTRTVSTNALYVHTAKRICATLKGRFYISEFDAKQHRYAIDFEQHCDGATAALYGAIRIHSNQPVRLIEKSIYNPLSETLTLPKVQINQVYYSVTLALVDKPMKRFKVISIRPAQLDKTAIHVPEVFNPATKQLVIPLIESTDVFGHRHQIRQVIFKSNATSIQLGTLFTLLQQRFPSGTSARNRHN